jgi:hypothetical protein
VWLFLLPAVIAVAALAWAILQPAEVCTSGGDTSVCTDYSDMKFFVATAGVGFAGLIAALLGFVVDLRRSAIAAGAVAGLALLGLAVASQIRVIT